MGLCGYVPVEIENFAISHVSYPHFRDDFDRLVLKNGD